MAKPKRPTFAAARQAIFAELGAQGWMLKPNLKTPQAQKDIDGHLVILHFKPEAVWMELKGETTSRSTHSDIRDYEPREWVAMLPRWMAMDLKLQRDLDANPGAFMAGDWVVVELMGDAYHGEVFVGRVLDDGGEDPDGAVWYRVDTNLTYQPQKFFRSEKMRLATDEEREDAIEYWQGPLPIAPLILQRGTNPSRTNPPPPRRGKPGEQSWGVYHPLTGKETFYTGYNEARARKVAIGLANSWPGIPVEYRGYVADSDGRWQWGELQSARNPRDESFIVQQYFGESSKPSWEGPLEDWIDAHPSLKPDTLAVLREMRPGSSFTLSDGTLTQTIRRVDEGRRRIAAGGRMRRNADCGCDHGRAKRMMNPRNY